jgi:hypothetical protein
MSSTATSSNFQSIFDAALAGYAKQTGIDLATHPFAQTLQTCNSVDAILVLLQEKASQFQEYRDGNRKLINALKPVVGVLQTVARILGEAATLVSLANQPVLSDPVFITLFLGSIPTYHGNPRWTRCPSRCAYSPHFWSYKCNMTNIPAV